MGRLVARLTRFDFAAGAHKELLAVHDLVKAMVVAATSRSAEPSFMQVG
jgi:hypothetical protein